MNVFEAGVQYDDFKGTCAADRADQLSLHTRLVADNLATENERIVGIRFCFSENSRKEVEKPGVVVYLAESIEHPTKVRAVEIDLTAAALFGFFKRLDVVMTVKGTDLSNVEVDGPHFD